MTCSPHCGQRAKASPRANCSTCSEQVATGCRQAVLGAAPPRRRTRHRQSWRVARPRPQRPAAAPSKTDTCPTETDRRAAHARLAGYFAARPLSAIVSPTNSAWQHASPVIDEALRVTLSDLEFVELSYRRNPADIRRLWALLAELRSETVTDMGAQMLAAYQAVVDDPGTFDSALVLATSDDSERGAERQLVWGVARLLADAGKLEAAIKLQQWMLAKARRDPTRKHRRARRQQPAASGTREPRRLAIRHGRPRRSRGIAHRGNDAVPNCRREVARRRWSARRSGVQPRSGEARPRATAPKPTHSSPKRRN